MQIQNYSNTNFKSVYPVYHWHNTTGKYGLASDTKDVKRYQRILTGMLNSRGYGKQYKSTDMLKEIIKFMYENDKNYQSDPYVRSVFNIYNGGSEKVAWNKNVINIEPCAYILTGKDARHLDELSKSIVQMSHIAKESGNKNLFRTDIDECKRFYGKESWLYAKNCPNILRDIETGIPTELHVIFDVLKSKSSKLLKMKFFKVNGRDNPLITHGLK